MVKKVLMVAFHFPPLKESSGLQRTLAFSRYLAEHGWRALVLSASPKAYPATSVDQLNDIPATVPVARAFARDSARHLAIKGRYLGWTALPDRWVSWLVGALPAGLRMVKTHRPVVIWSTYPIATAHLIGYLLHRLTGLPWVADFRDSMFDDHTRFTPLKKRLFHWIDRKTIEHCRYAVFTTQGSVELYRRRYPQIDPERFQLIPNGFNEQIFTEVEQQALTQAKQQSPAPTTNPSAPLVLLHSGVLYPSERDPQPFFQALADLQQAGEVDRRRLQVVLRATGHDQRYQPLLEQLGIADLVTLAPSIPYREALQEMLSVDGLLIFQASNCNHQVPAKIYEYFRAGKPVLALTDPHGDTANALREAGLNRMAPLDDSAAIRQTLSEFLQGLRLGREATVSREQAASYSRAANTAWLAQLLDSARQSRRSS